jgi:hypothetical protein
VEPGDMKHLLGYVIWNKERMLDWLADGILESFTPDQVDILFVLDGPYDGTDVKLPEVIARKLSKYNCTIQVFKEETWKFPCQNWMMQYCIDNNYKSLIAPQDDQKFTDPKLIENIDNLFSKYGENLGVIGLRDGFFFGYQNMISSDWSESVLSKAPRLKAGEYVERPLMNDGPIIYFNHVIKKIGFNDVENYSVFYIEDDYCARAHYTNGLTNILLGNSLIHFKNTAIASDLYYKNYEVHDLQTFRDRWKL